MRRTIGVIIAGALAVALLPSVALSAVPSLHGTRTDLGTQLMMRLFGETSDVEASVAGAYGDRASESPLRGVALHVEDASSLAAFVPDYSFAPSFAQSQAELQRLALEAGSQFATSFSQPGIAQKTARFTSPRAVDPAPVAATALPAESNLSYTVGYYEPVVPAAQVSPQPGTLAFGPLARPGGTLPQAELLAFGAMGATNTAITPEQMHVGALAFQGRVEGASEQSQQIALRDNSYGAGANFDLRAFRHNVNVDVSSNYEQLQRSDANFSTSAATTAGSWELPGADVPLAVPNYANMSKLSVGAGVKVPVSNALTLNFRYDAARLLGGYGLPGVTNLDAIDNTYGGKLIFAIPHSAGTLSIGAQQSRYQDNVLPANFYTQTREDVNFTVKF